MRFTKSGGPQLMLAIVSLVLGLALCDRQVQAIDDGEPCSSAFDPGCGKNYPVPCAKANCVAYSLRPTGFNFSCDDTTTPAAYTTNPTSSWANCVDAGSDYSAGKCGDSLYDCAYVWGYNSTTCTEATKCTGRKAFQYCGVAYPNTWCP